MGNGSSGGGAKPDSVATSVTLLAPLGDFPLEQSRDDKLNHASDPLKVIDGQLLEPLGWPLSYPHFSLIKDRLSRVSA